MTLSFAKSVVLAFILFLVPSSFGQVRLDYYLPPDVTYDRAIPTPESFFGFQVGEWHLTPDQIHAYLRVLDNASDRISMVEFGKTYEDRPMALLTITSPANHSNLQAIQVQHGLLTDPARSASLNIDTMPVVVWMGYSVHGNEPSGSNASVLVAYYLAAVQGPEIEKLLSEEIILINPSINPDGLNRFATWANMHRGKQSVADPASREHNEAWPGGRTNHYWFDLNRDWMPVQLPETQGRLKKYYEWNPNVLTDHHEMGTSSTFFFQPGVATRENPHSPQKVRELTQAIAQFHIRALDRIGSLYYSQEGFDDFYIGKGSSYPDVTGGIGILFEQASSRGHAQESPNGIVGFPFTIRNQVTTSLSTLTAAQALKKELLNHQREFFRSALQEAERSPVKAYVFGSKTDPPRTTHLIDILLRHQVQVHRLAKQVRLNGMTFEPDWAYIVPTAQPQHRLLTSLFERRTTFTDSLFYDISTWTLPLAFGLPSAETRASDRTLLGPRLVETPSIGREFKSSDRAYAYLLDWQSYYAPRALYRLLKAGIQCRVASKPFEIITTSGSRTFDGGTILVPLGIQQEKKDTIVSILSIAAREDGADLFSVQTGASTAGIDLGSSSFAPLKLPAVALLIGSGISSSDIGEAWHLLDRRMGMEVTLLDADVLGRVSLERYTTIVLAGSPSSIDSSGKATLKQWIGRGGTLIASEQGAEWAIKNKFAGTTLRSNEPSKKDSVIRPRPYAEEELYSRALAIPGTIFDVQYDQTHPLLYGYDSPLSVFRTTTTILEPSKNPYASPVRYTDQPLLSGYLNKSREKLVSGSAAVLVSGSGSGRVILFSDNPNFRAFWFGTNKLFLNSVFFGSTIRQSSARPMDNNQ